MLISDPQHRKRIPGILPKAAEEQPYETRVKARVWPMHEHLSHESSRHAERIKTVREVDRVRPPERLDQREAAIRDGRELVMLYADARRESRIPLDPA